MALAFFSTWTTYGTWLPGDDRGWFKREKGRQAPDPRRNFEAALLMSEGAVTLSRDQRDVVSRTIADHCAIRSWVLHAVNCRTNHVHVVVEAPSRSIELPREQFKSWCTRKLKVHARLFGADLRGIERVKWWADRGWDEYLDDGKSLEEVIDYVRDGQ